MKHFMSFIVLWTATSATAYLQNDHKQNTRLIENQSTNLHARCVGASCSASHLHRRSSQGKNEPSKDSWKGKGSPPPGPSPPPASRTRSKSSESPSHASSSSRSPSHASPFNSQGPHEASSSRDTPSRSSRKRPSPSKTAPAAKRASPPSGEAVRQRPVRESLKHSKVKEARKLIPPGLVAHRVKNIERSSKGRRLERSTSDPSSLLSNTNFESLRLGSEPEARTGHGGRPPVPKAAARVLDVFASASANLPSGSAQPRRSDRSRQRQSFSAASSSSAQTTRGSAGVDTSEVDRSQSLQEGTRTRSRTRPNIVPYMSRKSEEARRPPPF